MSNEDKLYEVDTFLAMCEDFMHGKDGDDATKCRRLINEVIKELSKLHQPTVSGRSEQLVCVGCGRTEKQHTGNGKDICPNNGGQFKAKNNCH
jgi:hypothetical protein